MCRKWWNHKCSAFSWLVTLTAFSCISTHFEKKVYIILICEDQIYSMSNWLLIVDVVSSPNSAHPVLLATLWETSVVLTHSVCLTQTTMESTEGTVFLIICLFVKVRRKLFFDKRRKSARKKNSRGNVKSMFRLLPKAAHVLKWVLRLVGFHFPSSPELPSGKSIIVYINIDTI